MVHLRRVCYSWHAGTRLAVVIPLLLVRHGQSQANAEHVLVGQSQDVALT